MRCAVHIVTLKHEHLSTQRCPTRRAHETLRMKANFLLADSQTLTANNEILTAATLHTIPYHTIKASHGHMKHVSKRRETTRQRRCDDMSVLVCRIVVCDLFHNTLHRHVQMRLVRREYNHRRSTRSMRDAIYDPLLIMHFPCP